MTYVKNPDTPLIGMKIPIIHYVRCPDVEEVVPIMECMGCSLYDHHDYSPDYIRCNHPDHNRGIRDAIQNKENIITAVVRGRGESTRCDAIGRAKELLGIDEA